MVDGSGECSINKWKKEMKEEKKKKQKGKRNTMKRDTQRIRCIQPSGN